MTKTKERFTYQVVNKDNQNPSSWRCAAYARDKYLTETNYNIDRQGMESIVKYEVQLLAGGKKWLFDKYIAGKLPMKIIIGMANLHTRKTWINEKIV